MSKFRTFVIVPREQEAAIEHYLWGDALARYQSETDVEPYPVYEDDRLSARELQLAASDAEALLAALNARRPPRGKWGVDADGRVYSLSTLNPLGRFDYWLIGGISCGDWNDAGAVCAFDRCAAYDQGPRLECNLRRAAELPPGWSCEAIVTPDGEWHELGNSYDAARRWDAERRVLVVRPEAERPPWDPERARREWEATSAAIVARHADHLVVLCSMHS